RLDEQILAVSKPEHRDGHRVVVPGEHDRIVPRGLVELDRDDRHVVRFRREIDAAQRLEPEVPMALSGERYDVLVKGRAGHLGVLDRKDGWGAMLPLHGARFSRQNATTIHTDSAGARV